MRTGPITQFWTSERPSTFFVPEDLAEFFILYFRERRIHHKNKPDSYRNVGGTHLKFVDESFGFRHEIPEAYSESHRGKYPDRQITVNKGKSFVDAFSHYISP